jgi:hypothetical protein
MGKKSGTVSGMNNPDHLFESLEMTFLGFKILKFFDADPGWKKFGSGINIPDPQDCLIIQYLLFYMFRAYPSWRGGGSRRCPHPATAVQAVRHGRGGAAHTLAQERGTAHTLAQERGTAHTLAQEQPPLLTWGDRPPAAATPRPRRRSYN